VVAQDRGARLLHDQLAHLVVHHHDLEERHAPRYPETCCSCRTPAAEELAPLTSSGVRFSSISSSSWAVRLLAVLADRAHQALRHDALDRRGEQEGSIPRSSRRTIELGRVVGVQRAEHQVARQRRLHGDLRRLKVADLADQDDVRVLTQEASQQLARRSAPPRVHLALAQPVDVVLDRVLGRQDLGLDVVELRERRVQRRRLARARGPVTITMPLGLR
jgi:hypothetical protein